MERTEILRQALTDSQAAVAIAREYEVAQALRDTTLKTASEACGAALRCGEMLLEMRERKRGEFLLWLSSYCPQISKSTAFNYMKISKLRRSLGNSAVDLQTVRQFYLLAGIMPPCDPVERSNTSQFLNFWALTKKITHQLALLPDNQKPRLREWWEGLGRAQGWLS